MKHESNVPPEQEAVQAALAARAADRASYEGAAADTSELPADQSGALGETPDTVTRQPSEPEQASATESRATGTSTGGSQAAAIVDLALYAGVALWHDATGQSHISIPLGGHVAHHQLDSRAVREWLARLHYVGTGRPAASQAMRDALMTLGGVACYEGEQHEVHVRVATLGDAIYLDLGDPTWRAVEITKMGWSIVAIPPVRFRRGIAVSPLPEPQHGGSLDALRDAAHIESDDHWRLLEAWLVAALRPRGPYPVLALDGEQGAGKSTRAKMLRRMIDPSVADLRADPREIRDLMAAANGTWIVAFDNVSRLPPWLSDALCRMSTGGALSTRQFFTNGDEHLMEAVRPVMLTGIAPVVVRGDLQDRTIALTLPAVAAHVRRSEAELWREFNRICPSALGALCDAVSCALRRLDDVHLTSLPRLADVAIWITAAEPALGQDEGSMLRAFTESAQQAVEEALDGDLLAAAIRGLKRPWRGTSKDLLGVITPQPCPKDWPKTPRGLSGMLKRLAPQLRRVGIEIEHPQRLADRREIIIRTTGVTPSSPSSPSPTPRDAGDDRGARPPAGADASAPGGWSSPRVPVDDGHDGHDGVAGPPRIRTRL